MSDDYASYIENVIHNAEMLKLNNMREDCKVDKSQKNYLMDIISYKKMLNIDRKKEKNVKYTNDDVVKKLSDYVFKRPWNKLHYEQKRIKMLEYIDKYLLNVSKNNHGEIRKILLEDLKNKKLNSGKTVYYDQLTAKIIGINGLDYDTKSSKYIYKR
jgi:hypothetical protein